MAERFIKFIKENWGEICAGIVCFSLVLALVVPVIIGIAKALWIWAIFETP